MKKLICWLFGASMFALPTSCGSDGTETVATTPLGVPSPVVTVESNTAKVRWIDIENAHQYAWELKTDKNETPVAGTTYVNNYSFTMEEGLVYEFRVRSKARAGSEYLDSEWSEYVSAASNMLPTPKPALVPASLTDNSATLEWEAVEDASEYRYELLDKQETTVKTGTEKGLSITLDELAEGESYRFRLKALTKAEGKNDSPWSAYVAFTTRAHVQLATPAPKASNRTANTATISWTKIEGAVKYICKLYKAGSENPLREEIAELPEVKFADLEPLTEYSVTIQALAPENDPYVSDSKVSEPLRFTTKSETTGDFDPELLEHEQGLGVRAFPGAEGAGMYTTGGRGGKVIHVTNLNDSGTGSLRAAIGQSGPRTIVFDVAGIIELKSSLEIKFGDLTIAGQTAPGNGICIKTHNMVVKADNVIIRYLHFRPGDESSDDGLDAIWGRYRKNIILDHCSMSWSTDECSSFYANKNFTMQWCLLGESLHNTRHTKGSHGYGGIWGGAPASFHHNIVAHHDSRNPRFDSPNTYAPNSTDNPNMSVDERRIDYRNNVVYNFCNYPAYGGEGQKFNFVGNIYKWGPASANGAGKSYKTNSEGVEVESPNVAQRREYFYQVDGTYTTGGKTYDYGAAHIYHNNSNILDTSVGGSSQGAVITADNQAGFPTNKNSLSAKAPNVTFLTSPLSIQYEGKNCYVTTHEASQLMDIVCAYAGATMKTTDGKTEYRDRVDSRIANDVKTGTAEIMTGSRGSQNGIIDSQNDVGGWPAYTASQDELDKVKDSDGDGIPDYYEDSFGLDSDNASDGNAKTLDPEGRYTNLEIYLHYLVKDITKAQTATGTYTELK